MRLIKIIPLLNWIWLTACEQQIKFEKVRWTNKEYPEAPPERRGMMLQDLTKNYKLVGQTQQKVIDLLGVPDYINGTILTYEISVDYGTDIDPVAGKYFDVILDTDSIVNSTRIREWKK
jgi:hypothetical protein